MFIGREQRFHPERSGIEAGYIAILGVPIVGLRIRARNVFSLIPRDREYRRILDAGSGPGVFAFELARRFPRAEVVGLDPSKEAVKACNYILDKIKIRNLEFRCIPIDEIKKEDCFDLVLCIDILEHIQDDLFTLDKLYTALSPGGVLVLHVPALYRRYPVWKKNLNFDVETHVRTGYELEEIQNKLKKAGFFIHNSGYTYGFWETLANNISYMITRAKMKNKSLYSLLFPILNTIAFLGARARPQKLGAGIFAIAEKWSK